MRRFLPFARSLAMRYSGGVEPSDDLVQVASLGLVSALERYDPERGVPFAAFAGPTILGELRRHFRDRVWTLRVPARAAGEHPRGRGRDHQAQPRARALADGRRDRRAAGDLRVRRARGVRGRRRAPHSSRWTARRPGAEPGDEAPMAERIGSDDPGFELVEDRVDDRRGHRGARRHRARGPAPALRRGPDPVEDRRAGRLLADARVADPAPRARQAARRGSASATSPEAELSPRTADPDREQLATVAVGSIRTSSARLSSEASSVGIRIPSSRRRAPPVLERADADLERARPARRPPTGRCRRESQLGRWPRSHR